MTSFYIFIILLSFHLINSQLTTTTSILDYTKTTNIRENNADETLTTTTVSVSTTIQPIETTITTSESTVSLNSTTIDESSIIDNNLPTKPSSKSGWWLLIAPLITVVAITAIGIIHYYRRQSPYRRFLQNWRSRDDDTDNIILQLEQPEIINGQWPPRISFA